MHSSNQLMSSVEQAVFTSSDRGRLKGYQLVSKSAGIDRSLSQELSHWAPTRSSSENPEDWTLSCFPVADEFTAITRTTLGGPEYSGRGGTQVVTLILMFRNEQLKPYAFNTVTVSKNAMAMGCLKLPLDLESEQLPLAFVPTYPIISDTDGSDDDIDGDQYEETLEKIVSVIEDGRRVAIIGSMKPMEMVDRLIRRMSIAARRKFSFTTGLEPSTRRPFQAHFFAEIDIRTRRSLQSQEVHCMNASL
jgi:hypothetical protein